LTLNNPIGVKVYDALDAMDYYFIIALSYNFELVWGKMCCKNIMELNHHARLVT
jgi:hypothetical protein